MIESTALDFWGKSEKPEIESYTIDHDFRKIQVKNTASYWLLPYIKMIAICVQCASTSRYSAWQITIKLQKWGSSDLQILTCAQIVQTKQPQHVW